MIFEGDKSVIQALKQKKKLIAAGQPHEHIKILLFVDGGLMKGAYAIGAGLVLEELGYNHCFSSIIGVSSGAPSVAYFISKETYRGASLLWEECCSRQFINIWRFWNQEDTNFLMNVLKYGKRQLHTDKIFTAPVDLYIAVTNYQTGKPHLIQPRTDAELFAAIQASLLMPNISADVVRHEGERYVDGGCCRPHALQLAIDEIEATHVLVLTCQDKHTAKLSKIERFLGETVFRRRMPKPLRTAAYARRLARLEAIAHIQNNKHRIPAAFIWGDGSIGGAERNPKKITTVVERSRQWWQELLA